MAPYSVVDSHAGRCSMYSRKPWPHDARIRWASPDAAAAMSPTGRQSDGQVHLNLPQPSRTLFVQNPFRPLM